MNDLIAVLKALSDPNRLRLLAAIDTAGELCACQLVDLLGVTGATCSQHLSQLVGSGLLTRRRAGRWMHFSRNAALADDANLDAIVTHTLAGLQSDPAWEDDRRRLVGILSVTPQTLCAGKRGGRSQHEAADRPE